MSPTLSFLLCMMPAVAAGNGQLSRCESTYYLIETNLGFDRAKFIGRVMDATIKEYDRRFRGFRGVVRRKPVVKVYATQAQYLQAFARACGEPSVNSSGVHCGLDGIVYTYDSKQLERTLKHECFHQFVHMVIDGRLPPWLNEGLAEYYEEGVFNEKSGRLSVGAVPAWRLRLLRAAQTKGARFRVDRLMKITRPEWHEHMDDDRGHIQYSQAWLLCHLLIHGDNGRYADPFERFLRHIDKGLDADSAFKRVFGADPGPLQEKLDEYLRVLKPVAP